MEAHEIMAESADLEWTPGPELLASGPESDIELMLCPEGGLQEANLKLQQLNKLKTAFVSIVSHELRTPVSAAMNSVQLLHHAGPLTADQQRFLQMAECNLNRLTEILRDLMTVSLAEAGRLQLRFAAVSVEEMLTEAASAFFVSERRSTHEIDLSIQSELPTVWADRQRIAQVLWNLLSNAKKFTPPGGSILVAARGRGDSVEIAVEDNGIGIPKDQQKRIFERFYQVEDVLTRSVEGSGLGLSIVRDLVLSHGGVIDVKSEPGRGSRFSFTLPVHSAKAEEMSQLDAVLGRMRSNPSNAIIVVENVSTNRYGTPCPSVAGLLRGMLPRTADLVVAQPASNRVVVVLPNTDELGARVVLERLREDMRNAASITPRMLGPAVYPRDGSTAWLLVASAVVGALD